MIDWKRVRQLRDEIGPDDFDDVAALFLDEVDAAVITLRSETPLSALEEALHCLKGSALSLGFKSLASLCQAGEMAARAGTGVEVTPIIENYAQSRDLFVTDLASQLES